MLGFERWCWSFWLGGWSCLSFGVGKREGSGVVMGVGGVVGVLFKL